MGWLKLTKPGIILLVTALVFSAGFIYLATLLIELENVLAGVLLLVVDILLTNVIIGIILKQRETTQHHDHAEYPYQRARELMDEVYNKAERTLFNAIVGFSPERASQKLLTLLIVTPETIEEGSAAPAQIRSELSKQRRSLESFHANSANYQRFQDFLSYGGRRIQQIESYLLTATSHTVYEDRRPMMAKYRGVADSFSQVKADIDELHPADREAAVDSVHLLRIQLFQLKRTLPPAKDT